MQQVAAQFPVVWWLRQGWTDDAANGQLCTGSLVSWTSINKIKHMQHPPWNFLLRLSWSIDRCVWAFLEPNLILWLSFLWLMNPYPGSCYTYFLWYYSRANLIQYWPIATCCCFPLDIFNFHVACCWVVIHQDWFAQSTPNQATSGDKNPAGNAEAPETNNSNSGVS